MKLVTLVNEIAELHIVIVVSSVGKSGWLVSGRASQLFFQEPSRDFSEQYQNDLLNRTHAAFDILRADKTIAGEMIWNFADFMTAQGELAIVFHLYVRLFISEKVTNNFLVSVH